MVDECVSEVPDEGTTVEFPILDLVEAEVRNLFDIVKLLDVGRTLRLCHWLFSVLL